MNIAYLVLLSIFSTNVLIHYGLPPYSKNGFSCTLVSLIPLTIITCIYGVLSALIFHFFIQPFGLIHVMPLVFCFLFFAAVFFWVIIQRGRKGGKADIQILVKTPASYSLLVYSSILVATTHNISIFHIAIASIAAIIGYVIAAITINDIMSRVSMNTVPETFKGYPILFINIGLVALAFAGLNEFFLYKLFMIP